MSDVLLALATAASPSVPITTVAACYIARLRRQLSEVSWNACHDHLTGLANRRALTPKLCRAAAGDAPFSVALIDLDHFKTLNDTYGHDAGDLVLSLIADRLRDLDRSIEVACRLGGDEFVLMIHGDETHGLAIAQHAWTAIAATPIPIRGNTITICASIGIATHRPGMSATELLRRADLAMFEAKSSGPIYAAPPARSNPPAATLPLSATGAGSVRTCQGECIGDPHGIPIETLTQRGRQSPAFSLL